MGARLTVDDVPVADGATIDDALGGGEDYELLATMPDAEAVEAARVELKEAFGVSLTEIGEHRRGSGLTAVDADGTERRARADGMGPLPMTHRRAATARAHDRRLATPAAAPGSRPTSRRSARSACSG